MSYQQFQKHSKTGPPENEQGNFWLWRGQSKFKLKTERGRVRQCHLSPRQVNAPVMRVGQSPEACEQAALPLLPSQAQAGYWLMKPTCSKRTTGS